jgi:hypothetical protein
MVHTVAALTGLLEILLYTQEVAEVVQAHLENQ